MTCSCLPYVFCVYEALCPQWEQQHRMREACSPGKHLEFNGNDCLRWSVSLQLLIHKFMTPIIPNQDSFWHDVTHAAAPHPSCVIPFILSDCLFSKSITCNLLLPMACGHWQFQWSYLTHFLVSGCRLHGLPGREVGKLTGQVITREIS